MKWSLVLCTVLFSCLTRGWAQTATDDSTTETMLSVNASQEEGLTTQDVSSDRPKMSTDPATPSGASMKVDTTMTSNKNAQPDNLNTRNLFSLVSQMVPELRQFLMSSLNLNSSQLKRLYDFVQSILDSRRDSVPGSLQDLLSGVLSSGLFSSANATSITGNFSANGTQQVNPAAFMAPYSLSWPKCALSDMVALFNGLRTTEMWAVKMVDASGKPERGLLTGNLKFMGNYLECNDIHYRNAETFTSVDGKICRAMITPPFEVPGAALLATPYGVKIQWDLCLPRSCQGSDLNRLLAENGLLENVFIYCTADLDMTDDTGAIIALLVLSILGVFLLLGTLLDIAIRLNERQDQQPAIYNAYVNTAATINEGVDTKVPQMDVNGTKESNGTAIINKTGNGFHALDDPKTNGTIPTVPTEEKKVSKPKDPIASLPKWQRALLAFSIPRNTEKILGVKAAPGSIGCLHGIRVLSMGMVILGHTIIFTSIYENPLSVFERLQTLAFQIILNLTLSVDSFFVMSGLLTCYLFLKQYGKKQFFLQKTHIILYYIHRYWRLTPPLMIWIMVVANLIKYVGEGRPAWVDYSAAQVCRDNWWINMLYINNVYKDDQPCLGVTWFLAHDMQFYVVAPLALIPWAFGKTIGKVFGFLMAFILIVIHLASTIWIEVDINGDILRNQPDYSKQIYFKPYARVAPFAIGLIMGWILWKTKCKIRLNKYVLTVGWIVSLGLILILTLVTYDENKYEDVARFTEGWSKAGRIVYETLKRPLWAMALSWIILACSTGYGGPINSILSWEGWLPMSRLTYSAFLVHLTVLMYEGTTPETTILFTSTTITYRFLSTTVVSYALAFILAVCVEAPMLGLERVLLK